MREGRLEEIKARLEGHDSGAYHDASDMAVGFGEVVSESLELVEEVERLSAFEERTKALLAEHLVSRREALMELDEAQRSGRPYAVEVDHVLYLDIEIAVMRKLLEEPK